MAELTNYAKNIISIQIEPKYSTNTYGNKNTIINHLSPSGFIRVTQKACGFVSILDVGEVGPSYNWAMPMRTRYLLKCLAKTPALLSMVVPLLIGQKTETMSDLRRRTAQLK